MDDITIESESTQDPQSYIITKMSEVAPNVEAVSRNVHGQKIYQKLLKRAGFNPNHVKYLKHFDNSETKPLGTVSRKLYNNVANEMMYNGFCQRINVKREDDDDFLSKMNSNSSVVSFDAASGESATGIVSILAKRGKLHDRRTGILTLEDGTPAQMPSLQTPLWKVGFKPTYHPPPGFAPSPAASLNSEGNHVFFSYDGDWLNGKMHGIGTYLYSDGQTYSGGFEGNTRCGIGRSQLPNKSSYEGQWANNKYNGKGLLKMDNVGVYDGYFVDGLFHGTGEIRLDCGLVYQADFRNGSMWGRAVITSNASGYQYDGYVHDNSIYGMGNMSFPVRYKKVQRFWPQIDGGRVKMTLKKAVSSWRESERQKNEDKKKTVTDNVGFLKKAKLTEYIKRCKVAVKTARLERKKEEKERKKQLLMEERKRLKEQRLKLLEAAYGADAAAEAAKEENKDNMTFSSDSATITEKKTDESESISTAQSPETKADDDEIESKNDETLRDLDSIDEEEEDDDEELKSRVEDYHIKSKLETDLIEDALKSKIKEMTETVVDDVIFRVSDKEQELLKRIRKRNAEHERK